MTNNTPPRYESPGAHGEPVPHGPGAGMLSLINHLLDEFPGSSSLGCYSNRNVRNGHSTSLHAVSRAFDWKYANLNDRDEVWKAITAEGIGHVLGIQACHDYNTREGGGSKWGSHTAKARTWGHNQGIHFAHVGPGDTWLHIELCRDASVDPRLMERVGKISSHGHAPVAAPVEHSAHVDHVQTATPGITVPKHTISRRSRRSDNVRNLQQQLRAWHHRDSRIPDPGFADGRFGPRSQASLKEMQRHILHVAPDGVYGKLSEAAWVKYA